MPATKRQCDGATGVAFAKKQRLCDEAALTEDELESMTNQELIEIVIILQKALHELQEKNTKALAESSGNAAKAAADIWTPEKVAERAAKARDICRKEIKKQMKWQPSCKRGSTKWSYQGIVPNVEVFNKMFNIDEKAKAFKLKKIPRDDFGGMFGYISASCRYDDLNITGENVNLKWNKEELTFQLSGTYGIGF
ncbi:Hypothetical predicted protein [Lecanosticta acicola]|uniref:Uncharacterized protein n=1 Tax=Lecanosticta acicola TaxID=111012 RepID=A0AAI8Z2U7_9PEZI|nr:Hypothetical predicted protein [Lecanosticta acicola]